YVRRTVLPLSCLPKSLLFFSSRRRHTRFSRDWSSDVCSSDLPTGIPTAWAEAADRATRPPARSAACDKEEGAAAAARFPVDPAQIGRASCRERVQTSVGAGLFTDKYRTS